MFWNFRFSIMSFQSVLSVFSSSTLENLEFDTYRPKPSEIESIDKGHSLIPTSERHESIAGIRNVKGSLVEYRTIHQIHCHPKRTQLGKFRISRVHQCMKRNQLIKVSITCSNNLLNSPHLPTDSSFTLR